MIMNSVDEKFDNKPVVFPEWWMRWLSPR